MSWRRREPTYSGLKGHNGTAITGFLHRARASPLPRVLCFWGLEKDPSMALRRS